MRQGRRGEEIYEAEEMRVVRPTARFDHATLQNTLIKRLRKREKKGK